TRSRDRTKPYTREVLRAPPRTAVAAGVALSAAAGCAALFGIDPAIVDPVGAGEGGAADGASPGAAADGGSPSDAAAGDEALAPACPYAGMQTGAPWPTAGRCATRTGTAGARGPAGRPK